jgi:peptide/nickel transport system ATP-binding protein
MKPHDRLLDVRDLCKYFPVHGKGYFHRVTGIVKAVDRISFELMPGETLGLVGESGSGKTTAVRSILRALQPTSGRVLFRVDGTTLDLANLEERQLKPLRSKMQMVFQDPFSSLNPRMTVGGIVGEPLVIHKVAKGSELRDRVAEMLVKVGLKPQHAMRFPHAFSGGQRQRIGIARALILRPSLLVADEPVSALDVSVQAQVINLLTDLKEEFNLAILFVAHDLTVVKHISDRVAVMYAGRIVEMARTEELFAEPLHPYTQALLSAVPHPDPDRKMRFQAAGEVADPAALPPGCSFHPRCPHQSERCREVSPELSETSADRFVACHLCVEGFSRTAP